MREIVQIEHRQNLLSTREDLLRELGHPILTVLGVDLARAVDLGSHEPGVIVIGHGAPWHERVHLVSHFKCPLPSVGRLRRAFKLVFHSRREDINMRCSLWVFNVVSCRVAAVGDWVQARHRGANGIINLTE